MKKGLNIFSFILFTLFEEYKFIRPGIAFNVYKVIQLAYKKGL